MKTVSLGMTLVSGLVLSSVAFAQEVKVHHGFLFFAGESYTVDEQTFGIHDDGHEFSKLIAESKRAVDYYDSYRSWHITANVLIGFSFAAIVFGGVAYMPGVEKNLPENIGLYSFASGGGLLVLSCVFEFIAWGKISSAAEAYNKGLFDDGTGALDTGLIPTAVFSPAENGGYLSLAWRF